MPLRVNGLEIELKVKASEGGELGPVIDKVAGRFKALEEQVERVKKRTIEVAESRKELEKLVAENDKVTASFKKAEDAAKQEVKTLRTEARTMRALASSITSGLEKEQIAVIKNIASQIEGISRTALITGGGIVGGIFAAAGKYVKDAKEATAVTIRWKAEQESLNKSSERIGAVLAEQALPLLEKAADLADKASKFVEDNPDVVRAALNTGVALATLGAVGIAVTKGIKLVADVRELALIPVQLEAARLQDKAADKQLEAALLQAKSIATRKNTEQITNRADDLRKAFGLDKPEKAPSLLNFGPLAAILAGAAGYSALGRGAANFGAKQFGFESPEDFWQKMLEKLGLVKSAADSAADSLGGTADVLSVSNSPQFDNILKAYEDYKSDDLDLVRKHYAERAGIVQDALNAELEENRQYAASVAKVNQNTASSLTKAANDFEQANIKAETKYQEDRAKIITDGARDLAKIQEKLQDRLRKLAEEHADRQADLTASRDALGLAKENRSYRRAVADEKRSAAQEARDLKQSIAERLADLKQSYEQERAQRLADYQARVAEIKAQAAERLKELAAQHQEELRKIREQRAAKLRELDTQFNEERKRRYQYFLQQIKDLDAALVGETNRKRAEYEQDIRDLDDFLTRVRAGFSSLNNTSTSTQSPTQGQASSTWLTQGFSSGGYASGMVRTGEQGMEYILSNQTVKAAERLIGGRLTQEGLVAALMNGRQGTNVTVNNNGRFSGEYTASMRRAVRKDMQDALQTALGLA